MKTFEQYIRESIYFRLGGKDNKGRIRYNYTPKEGIELFNLIKNLIKERGNEGNFNDIDTSNVTNMNSMFYNQNDFNEDISLWDTSNVTSMRAMFYYANSFNQDISQWDTSKVTKMFCMFRYAESFNQDISNWDVSEVTNMYSMFESATSFNQDISQWDISKAANKDRMFVNCPIKEEYKPKFKK